MKQHCLCRHHSDLLTVFQTTNNTIWFYPSLREHWIKTLKHYPWSPPHQFQLTGYQTSPQSMLKFAGNLENQKTIAQRRQKLSENILTSWTLANSSSSPNTYTPGASRTWLMRVVRAEPLVPLANKINCSRRLLEGFCSPAILRSWDLSKRKVGWSFYHLLLSTV